eukprot:2660623-Pleurochrysis_carterae.AAC.1
MDRVFSTSARAEGCKTTRSNEAQLSRLRLAHWHGYMRARWITCSLAVLTCSLARPRRALASPPFPDFLLFN